MLFIPRCGTIFCGLLTHSLDPRNRTRGNDGKRTGKTTIAKNNNRRPSGMNDKIAGMNVRRQNIVQGDRFAASQRNHGVRRVCGARRHIAGEPGVERGRCHDRRQPGQIDVVIDRREIRNRVGAGRFVENKLICAAAARKRVVVAGGENHVLVGRARQRHGRRRARGEVEDKIHRIGCAEAVCDCEGDFVGRRRGCPGIVSNACPEFGVDGGQKAGAG